jgi:uncharacterized protein (TIGR03437 family)
MAFQTGYGQVPEVTAGSVLNAASWSSPVAAGELVAIFGSNLATGQQSAAPPLPLVLAGTSVAIDGVPAPILFVSPTQINVQVPSSLTPPSNYDVATAHVVVSTPAGSSSPAALSLTSTFPGLFTSDASGCGQAAALNIVTPYAATLNTAMNSAAPGDYIALFGTGFGLAVAQPADGAAATVAATLRQQPGVYVDGNLVASTYAGLAPGLAGVDQINFQLPASAREGCAVPVSASLFLGSPQVTLSVQKGRGKCSDPPIQSYGQITLYKATFSGPATLPTASDAIVGSFPSAPGLQAPTPTPIVYAPDYVANIFVPTVSIVSTDGAPISTHNCSVPGYSHLSAGTIQIEGPNGASATAAPQALQGSGVSYGTALPDGFIGPGTVTLSGTDGNDVDLHATFPLGPPIQVQTSFPAGTNISESQPLTVKWTGGDSTELVKLTLISAQGSVQTADYTYAPASAGSLTISPVCTNTPGTNFCTWGLPLSSNAQIVVDVIPAPDHTTSVSVPGVTGPVQLTYQYSYTFTGLTLGN